MALVFDDRYQPREESAEALQRLFDVCFDSADAFSLSRAAWARQNHTLERALEPYVLRRLRTTRWFCYYTANSNSQRIALYPLNEQTKSILRAVSRAVSGGLERETSALGSVDGRSVLFQKRNASARNGLT